jgi:hypothetical protein
MKRSKIGDINLENHIVEFFLAILRVVSTGVHCVRCPVRDRACKAQIRAIADEKTDPSVFSPGFRASRMGQRTQKAPVETTLYYSKLQNKIGGRNLTHF